MGWKRSKRLQKVLRLDLWVIWVDRGTRRLSSAPLCQQVFRKHTDSSHSNRIDKTYWSCCSWPQDVSLLTVSWNWIFFVLFPSECWKQWWWERGQAICARCRLVSRYQIWRGLWPYEYWWVKLISYSYCWPPAQLPRAGADQLLTSDINPSVVTRTFKLTEDNVTNYSGDGMRDTGNRLGVLSLCVEFFHCFTSLDSTKRISAALLTISLCRLLRYYTRLLFLRFCLVKSTLMRYLTWVVCTAQRI